MSSSPASRLDYCSHVAHVTPVTETATPVSRYRADWQPLFVATVILDCIFDGAARLGIYVYMCSKPSRSKRVFCHAYSALMAHNRRPPRTQRVGAALGPAYLDCCAPLAVGCFSPQRVVCGVARKNETALNFFSVRGFATECLHHGGRLLS